MKRTHNIGRAHTFTASPPPNITCGFVFILLGTCVQSVACFAADVLYIICAFLFLFLFSFTLCVFVSFILSIVLFSVFVFLKSYNIRIFQSVLDASDSEPLYLYTFIQTCIQYWATTALYNILAPHTHTHTQMSDLKTAFKIDSLIYFKRKKKHTEKCVYSSNHWLAMTGCIDLLNPFFKKKKIYLCEKCQIRMKMLNLYAIGSMLMTKKNENSKKRSENLFNKIEILLVSVIAPWWEREHANNKNKIRIINQQQTFDKMPKIRQPNKLWLQFLKKMKKKTATRKE